jgi:AcrR family transcriptional regulator
MAYRVTDKIQKQLDARRASIIKATIDVISKRGMVELTVSSICEQGEFSMGLIYKEFPDLVELKAAAAGQVLDRDREAMRKAVAEEKNPMAALAAALTVLYARMVHPHLVHAMVGDPVYSKGMRSEIEGLIDAALDVDKLDVKHAARAVLGVLSSMAGAQGLAQERSQAAVLFALRGIGFTDATARRVFA